MTDAPAPDLPLRVATFNIHHGSGVDGRLDLERVAALIEATAADVVGLQEVDRHFGPRSGFADQAVWLAQRLRLHAVYGANVDVPSPVADAPARRYGTALLTAFEVLEWRNTPLPRPRGGEPRGLLEALVDARGTPLRVVVTHLENSSAVERLAQAEAIRARLAAAHQPLVLLGDLNAAPASPEVAILAGGLVDAWASAGEGPGYTFDAARPRARIDYVLTSPELVVRSVAVVPSAASDHLPVVADLALVPGAQSAGGRPPAAGGWGP